jgi:hypothetical protein
MPLVQARAAPIPQESWNSINRKLTGIVGLPSARDIGAAIDAMFEGEVPAVVPWPQAFDYLEDPLIYKSAVRRALDRYAVGDEEGSETGSEFDVGMEIEEGME